ncbi:MAG: CcdB family protein [Rhodocyclaceae bacterium]|jgi:toxin CcdB|nr:CcdB family protein [Rhodocyclaceae bacterium]
MAQFDVYPNPNPSSRSRIPYLVALPSDLLGTFDATVVAPLRLKTDRDVVPVLRLNPQVQIDGATYFLRPQELAAIATRSLKNPIANLSPQREEILAALDFLFTGF